MKLDEVSSCSSNFCATCTDAVLKMSLQPSRKKKHERKKQQQQTNKTAAINDNFAHFYLFLDAFPCGRWLSRARLYSPESPNLATTPFVA